MISNRLRSEIRPPSGGEIPGADSAAIGNGRPRRDFSSYHSHVHRLLAGILFTTLICAQTPTPKLAFEVASVKPGPNDPPMDLMRNGRLHQRIDDSQIDLGAILMLNLLVQAFGLPYDQIKGPAWMEQANYDIVAKLPAGSSKKQVPEMLQTLLADRFKLVFHREQKMLPVYELKVGSGALHLMPSIEVENDTVSVGCNGGIKKTCHKVTMEMFAGVLSSIARMASSVPMTWAIDRPVIDQTGLKGQFDFTYEAGIPRGEHRPEDERSLVDAVQSLGLKLEPSKGPFDYIVIDRIEHVPTENF
jgi:uncharacterized protein (TIGR03435 family)